MRVVAVPVKSLAREDAAVPRPDGARARRAHARDARGRPGRGALRARLGDRWSRPTRWHSRSRPAAEPDRSPTKPPLANAIRQVETKAKQDGASALAVLPADVPLVTVDTLHEALRTLGAVVLALGGRIEASLLLRRPPRAIPARFGPDSFRRHVELAGRAACPSPSSSAASCRSTSIALTISSRCSPTAGEGGPGRSVSRWISARLRA